MTGPDEAAKAAPAAEERVLATAWDHSSLAVADLNRSVAFYEQAFGYELVFADHGMTGLIEQIAGIPGVECDLAQLRLPGSEQLLELIAFRNPGPDLRLGLPPGGHVAFRVGDLELSLTAVEALGARMVGEVTTFPEGRSVYCREPGGSVFELSEEL